MILASIAFYVFSFFLILSALKVITSSNPVHAVLFLILAFFSSSGLFVLLGAEFIAMLMVIVYVGAVAVLFLFIVMMLNIDFNELKKGFTNNLPVGLLVAVITLVELIFVINISLSSQFTRNEALMPIDNNITNTQALGKVLYTDYILAFQMSGLVLLVAMIGALILTLRTRNGVKKQSISAQVSRSKQNSIEIIKDKIEKGA
jgi:NADH-quinone oxidoreductase subunit J